MGPRERDNGEVKRPRGTGGFSGGLATVSARHGRGYVSQPVHLELPGFSSALAILRS